MPEEIIRGVRISYEIIGRFGPWVVLTPGSRHAFQQLVSLGTRLANKGYRVLLHDRRNCGASEVAFDLSSSEDEIWVDDLYELARRLHAFPHYVGGPSAGARLAILLALRHPSTVKGLLLWRITGGRVAVEQLAASYYGQFISAAKTGGMEAVCKTEHFRDSIQARPSNRDRLMQIDPDQFIRVMTNWQEHFLESTNLPIIGATVSELRSITTPACMIAGNDRIHPPAIARKAKELILNSELHEDIVEKRSDDNLLPEWDREDWARKEELIARIFLNFLQRVERSSEAK